MRSMAHFNHGVFVSLSKAVVLGNRTVCDGHEDGYTLRVVTHAHADHLYGLRNSTRKCDLVVSTRETKDLLSATRRCRTSMIVPVHYNQTIKIRDEKVTLIPANHILGSAQVLVERSDGLRCLYSSDFRLDGTPTVKCDVLVLDATYGAPSNVRPSIDAVHEALITLVESSLKTGKPVHVFGFIGKVQEVMSFLRRKGITVPFVTSPRMYRVSRVYEKYGFTLGEYYSSEGVVGRKILKDDLYIAFFSPFERTYLKGEFTRMELTGWLFGKPYVERSKNEYVISYSGHSDFNQLIEYAAKCDPEHVITDNARGGSAIKLAEEIEKRLGIPASPSP
ncbi:MAG: hypothetical protein ACTSWP_03100 [Candidatus Freyarchaeota archaeon]